MNWGSNSQTLARTRATFFACALGIVLLFVVFSSRAQASTLRVPGDYATIGEALGAAVSGDVVEVGAGTYYENVTVAEGVTLRGAGRIETIIDGQRNGSVIFALRRSTVEHLTVTNGSATIGGGIYCYDCVLLQDLVISENQAYLTGIPYCCLGGVGGGVAVIGRTISATVKDSLLLRNSAANYFSGSALYVIGSSPRIEHNEIRENTGCAVGTQGIGLTSSPGGATVVDNLIELNGGPGLCLGGEFTRNTIKGNGGGGVYIPSWANASLSENLITENVGSGVVVNGQPYYPSSVSMHRDRVLSNSEAGVAVGGGAYSFGYLTNVLVAGNNGPGLSYCTACIVANSTIVGNQVGIQGAYNTSGPYGPPPFNITNSIVWGNQNGDLVINSLVASVVSHSNIGSGGFPDENGNISVDPLFVDSANGDYHLSRSSPMIDQGTNSGAPVNDLDGNPRPLDGDRDGNPVTDIGAYEYIPQQPPTLTAPVVDPIQGTTDTIFTYKAIYTDPDNDAPSSPDGTVGAGGAPAVVIDGASHAMTLDTEVADPALRDGNYQNGEQYIFTTTLPEGSHTYHFEASDGTDSARLPESGELEGPVVVRRPDPPENARGVIGNKEIDLFWDMPTEDIDGWNIYMERDRSAEIFTLIGTVKDNPFYLVLEDYSGAPLTNGQSYRFVVTALRDSFESEPSNIFTGTPNQPCKPSDTNCIDANRPQFPVVFLHGIKGSAEAWGSWVEKQGRFNGIKGWLIETARWAFGGELKVLNPGDPHPQIGTVENAYQGFSRDSDFFTVNFGNNHAQYANQLGIRQQGFEVQAFLNFLAGGLNKKFTLMAHSMGGLAARSYIQDTTLFSHNVHHLVTYGTPHNGVNFISLHYLLGYVPVWDLLISHVLPQPDTDGVRDMIPGSTFLSTLNDKQLPNIKYTRIRGKVPGIDIVVTAICVTNPITCELIRPFASSDLPVNTESQKLDVLYPQQPIRKIDTNKFHIQEPKDLATILCALNVKCVMIQGNSPIDLVVHDSNGGEIMKTASNIPGASYTEITEDGHTKDTILIPFPIPGNYNVEIIADSTAQPTDMYSLTITADGITTLLADNTHIQDIPTGNYQAHVSDVHTLVWLSPVKSDTLTIKDKETFPLKFGVYDSDHQFVHDDSVTIRILDQAGVIRKEYVYAENGNDGVRIHDDEGEVEPNYQVILQPKNIGVGPGAYTLQALFGNPPLWHEDLPVTIVEK